MTKLVRTLLLGVVLSTGTFGVAFAGEKGAKLTAADVKVGDKVHVCGCGAGCHCGGIKAEAGKCGCGKDLIPATVTKVESGKITVDRGGVPGETTF